MVYSEALEQQVALLRWSESPARRRFFGEVLLHEDWQMGVVSMLRGGETFWVSPDLTTFVARASETLPDVALSLDLPPTSTGFCWFGDGIVMPAVATPKDGTVVSVLRGVSWGCFTRRTKAWYTTNSDDIEGILIIPWCTAGFLPHVIPWAVHEWRFGVGLEAAVATERPEVTRQDAVRRVFGIVYAFWALAQQRILVASQERAERHARKRLERQGWTGDLLIRVVQLRRKERAGGESVYPTDREYSCQWVVRGHWRQQWYPKQQHNQPKWILPYVKGPEGKPLKAPRATVFAVVR